MLDIFSSGNAYKAQEMSNIGFVKSLNNLADRFPSAKKVSSVEWSANHSIFEAHDGATEHTILSMTHEINISVLCVSTTYVWYSPPLYMSILV